MSNALVKSADNGLMQQAGSAHATQSFRPWASAPVDILEGDEAYLVIADVPGVKRDDIDIEFVAGELRLSATRNVASDPGSPLSYRRAFTLGRSVDVDNISAELDKGVLSVYLPKTESAKPRQIAVRTA